MPNILMATYYGQRASAGLMITKATQVSLQGKGYARTPDIYTPEQVQGWKLITQAVHEKGGKIFLQLWHVGRLSPSKVNGLQHLAPSAKAAEANVYIFDGARNGDATFVPAELPKAMTQEDIAEAIGNYRLGARNAIAAGSDGVEIHGANGYLIDQFLRSNSNLRTDEYGGSPARRTRFLIEVAAAVAEEVGRERVGVRISPFVAFKDMSDPEIFQTLTAAIALLNQIGVAYLHLCEADWGDTLQRQVPVGFSQMLRKKFECAIIATGKKHQRKDVG